MDYVPVESKRVVWLESFKAEPIMLLLDSIVRSIVIEIFLFYWLPFML